MNGVGEAARSTEILATPFIVPSAARNFSARTSRTLGIDLTWGVPRSNDGSPNLGYRIYRGTVSGSLALFASVAPGTEDHDTTTVASARSIYGIEAFNASGITWPPETSAIAK